MNGPESAVAERPEPPPRPRAGRRWIRRILWTLGVLTLLFGLLHTSPAKRFVASALADLAGRALGADVGIERLDYRLWAGEMRVEGVHLRRPRLEIECARAEVDVGLGRGPRVDVEAPRVVVTQGPRRDGAPPPEPSRPWAILERLDAVNVRRGALELRSREETPWLRLEGVEVTADTPNDRLRGSARVAGADVGWPGAGVRVESVGAAAELELEPGSGAVRILRGEVVSGETKLEAQGRLDQIEPILARAEGGGRVDARLIQHLVPDLEIEGQVDVRATFEKDQAGARGSLEVEAADLRVFEVGPWSGAITATLQDRRLQIDSLNLGGYHGRAEARGAVFLGDGPSSVDVRAFNLDVKTLVATFVDDPPPLASRADAELRVEIRDWEVDTLQAQGRVSLRRREGAGWPVVGPVTLGLADRRVSFSSDALRVRTAQVATEGSFTFAKALGLRYEVRVPGLDGVPELLADAGFVLPSLVLGGGVGIEGEIGGRLPDWQATARIISEGLSVEGIDVGLDAALKITRSGVEVESFEAEGPDGRLSVAGFVPLEENGAWSVEGKIGDLRLTDALDLHGVPIPAAAQGRLRVEGTKDDPTAAFEIEARVDASSESGARAADSESSMNSLSTSEGSSSVDVPAPEDAPPEREAATLRVAGTASRRGVVVDDLTAALGGGAVTASGAWLSDGGSLEGRARMADVELARMPWLPGPPLLDDVHATLSGEADVSGRPLAREGRVQLLLASTRFRRTELPDVALEAVLEGAEARLAGRLGEDPLLSGRVGLADPWPLHLDLELAALPLTRLLRSFPRIAEAEGTVTLAGRASLDLPLRAPQDVRYEAQVEALDVDLGYGGSSVSAFTVSGSGERVILRGLDLRAGESRLWADGELGLTVAAESPLSLRGDIPLGELAFLLPEGELAGQADVDVRIAGRLAEPDVSGTVHVSEGRGRIGALQWEGLELHGTAERGLLTLEQAWVRVAEGEISARGVVPLRPLADGARTLEVELRGVDPGSLLPVDPGAPPLVAPLDMSVRLQASAPALDALEAEGEITSWSVGVGDQALSLEAPATCRFQKGGLSLEGFRFVAPHGRLSLEGQWRLGETLVARLDGEADLVFLNPLLGGELRLSGPARFELGVNGHPSDLTLEGGVDLQGARAVLREPPVVVNDLTGTLEARGRGLTLDASGNVGDGTLRAAGQVKFSRTGPEVDVALDAERVPLSYPDGLRSRSSATIRVIGRERRYRVEGDVTVHRALFDRETDFANQSLDNVGAELKALEARGSVLERVQLDVRVRLAEGLRVQNRKLKVIVDGAVVVGGDLLTPELRGALTLRDGGTVRLSRATMRLVDGRISLAGFPSRPPEIDVSGRTQVTGIQIDIDLNGPLDDLRTSLSSPNRSDLTQADLATLLLTGRTAQAAADESGAIVAEEVAAALGSALNERLGGAILIDVSRDESLIVQDTDPTQRFNVGIPIGERLYVIYSQALDRSGVRWILDFRPQGQFRLRLISDEVDTGAVEVSHGFEFDLWSRGRRTRPRPPERPRVREIRIEGIPGSASEELRRKAKLKAGDRYDFFEGEKSARRMQEHLVDEGYRAALVEPAEKAVGEGAVDVVFRVEPGPRIVVEWVGDDPGGKLRKRFGEVWDAYLSVGETATRRARDLREALRAQRYYQAIVSADVGVAEDAARVTFDVQRGPRGAGVDLLFEGNDSLSDELLAAVLPPRKDAAFFALIDPRGRTRLDTALRTAGARAGFLSLEAGAPREAFDPETGRLQVTIPIEEGERAELVSLDLPEEALSLEGSSPPALELRVGEPFRIDAYVDDRSILASWFRDQGYPEARLAGILEPVPGGLAVRFEVDAGSRPRVGQVRPGTAGRTRPSVIDNAVTVKPGDLIRPREVAHSRDRLSETRVFRSVDIRAETTDQVGVRDLVVDLAERPDLNVEYKIRWETGRSRESSDEPQTEESRGLQFGVGVEAASPFGRAHRYSVYGLAGKRRQLFGATFESQTFFGRRWRTQLFVFDDDQRDFEASGITRRVRSIAFQQTKRWRSGLTGRRWHDRLRMQWGYAYRRLNYTDPATGDELAGNRAGIANSLIGDTRDSVTDPHRGLFWTATAEPNLKVLGSDEDLVRLYGQVFAYVPLGSRVVWAQALRIGVVPGEDPLLLLDRRFKAGGANTVRGFAENGLGPQRGGFSIGGQALFVFNQELRFPIPVWDRLQGGVFFDAGNVWTVSGGLDLRDLRSNVGAGVRVMFPFGPVRLDWAWVLDPQEGEQRSRWQFALGHAF